MLSDFIEKWIFKTDWDVLKPNKSLTIRAYGYDHRLEWAEMSRKKSRQQKKSHPPMQVAGEKERVLIDQIGTTCMIGHLGRISGTITLTPLSGN